MVSISTLAAFRGLAMASPLVAGTKKAHAVLWEADAKSKIFRGTGLQFQQHVYDMQALKTGLKFEPYIYQSHLKSRSSIQSSAEMPHKAIEKSSSMYPALHKDVAVLLGEDQLNFEFHAEDDDNCVKNRDINVRGRFFCNRKACSARGWWSGVIPITIRMYRGRSYNARVYHQRCAVCNSLAKPKLDESYAERVSRRLKIWSGVKVPRLKYGKKKTKRPHQKDLCEGCKAGHCMGG